ncbi:hypothetical protein [Halomonas sp. PR-M31]|uniref:hypothetical protein n=1 Tax=Halomonas sp. PR-M31 TaxID=1471202 RepID=UPI000AA5C847|nr:hypothetical protein [Halomonas sp. PR-M31]
MKTQRPSATPTVQLDNDRVIVTRWDFPPDGETGWHRHEYDYVVVPMADGVLNLETPEGLKEDESCPKVFPTPARRAPNTTSSMAAKSHLRL